MKKIDFSRKAGKYIFYILVILFGILAIFTSPAFVYLIMFLATVRFVYDIYFKKINTRENFDRIVDAFNIKREARNNMPADFPFPTAVFETIDGDIIWANDSFVKISKTYQNGNISDAFRNFVSIKEDELKDGTLKIELDGRKYIVYKNQLWSNQMNKRRGCVIVHLVDITKYSLIKEQYENSRPVVAIIMIDNYEDLIKRCTEAEKSLILANIDNIIFEWCNPTNGTLLRYDRDRYLFVFESGNFKRLLDTKFSVLDKIKSVCSNDKIAATLSIGIGSEGQNLKENFGFAKLAIDMALSRSGDQVVIKKPSEFEFFGGRAIGGEKRTRVRSRVYANVLKNIIADSSYIMVMGHKMADLDCVGAEAGIACIARNLDKKCYIVMDREQGQAEILVKKLENLPQYEDTFITPAQAVKMNDGKMLVVVVDTNRPESVEEPRLLSMGNKIVLIDHHRRAASYINDCVINMHEPRASSASELSAELVQYIVKNEDVLKEEAEAMLSGIYLDTKSFSMKAGEHTFETAAQLRRMGADTVEVKRLFQSEKNELVEKNRIVENAQVYFGSMAISKSEIETSRATAGKAADELLDITGVKASIVIFICNKRTLISARSLGDANVQLIMEKLGGGGTLTNAGAQLDISIDEAQEKLMTAIKEYLQTREK